MKTQKPLIQYKFEATNAFFNFLKTGDEEALKNRLYGISSHARTWIGMPKGWKNKDIWFRFFEGDTLATTINDITRDLHSPNADYIKKMMQIAVDDGELQVYYS